MKRYFLVLTIVFITSLIYAQSNKLGIGFIGGGGISNIDQIIESGVGYTGHIFGEYNVSEIFTTYVSLGFEQKNDEEFINVTETYQVEIKRNYSTLIMPILLRAKFGSKVKFFVNVGPSFNYLLKYISNTNNITTNTQYDTDFTNNRKRFEIGISAGAGLLIPITDKLYLPFELRSNIGLNNLSKIELATIKTNSTLLLVGLAYRL